MNRAVQSAQEEVRRLIDVVVQTPHKLPELPVAQMDMTLRIARRSRLLGRLASHLETAQLTDRVPEVLADQLRSSLVMADARKRLALWELDRIAWAVNRSDLPLIMLKGCAYAVLDLPNARGRVFADVDLLMAEEELNNVEAILNATGWETQPLSPYDQNYYRNWTHELPPLVHCEREVEIDLHHNLVPRTARLKPHAEKFLERARPLRESRYCVLCDEDIVLHAMVHLMFSSDLADQMRDLVDIHDLLGHFAKCNASFWEGFVSRTEELAFTRPAFYSLRYCSRLLKTPVPDHVLNASRRWAPPRVAVWLMDILVPHALYPPHPDVPNKLTRICRLFLYVRSHWIRMPPWLLAYHLSHKFVVTRILRKPRFVDAT